MITEDALLAIHLLGAVIWVGGMVFAYLALRPSLAVLGPDDRRTLMQQVFRRFFLLVWHAMPIVLITGYAQVFAVYGGFANLRWNVNLMHVLGLIMAAVFVYAALGPFKTFRRSGDAAAFDRIRKLVLLNMILGLITVVIAALN